MSKHKLRFLRSLMRPFFRERGSNNRYGSGLGLTMLLFIGPDTHAMEGVKLTVTVNGVETTEGEVLIRIFNSEAAWLDKDMALKTSRVPATIGSVSTRFTLSPGSYAVSVIHDADSNGIMNMQWLPYPRPSEGAGSSNDPRPTLGPPDYSDARFLLSEDTQVVIQMWY